MRFSVIVPVYNVAEYLRKCAESIIANDCSDSEILLVDDGSTDGISGGLCDQIAAEHPDLIRVIHKPNGGLGDARNAGIAEARGEYLVFIDSDDHIAPDYLATVSAHIDKTHADVYTFDFFCQYADRTEIRHDADKLPEGVAFTLAQQPTLLLHSPTAWSRVWKRSLFLSTDIRYPGRVWYEDIRTSGKLFAQAGSIVAIHKPLYYYVIRENSITHNKNVDRNRQILDAMEDLLPYFKAHGLFDTYRNELCQLVIDHVLIAASVRVLRCDRHHPLLGEFYDYTLRNFPDFRHCPYLSTLSGSKKLAYRLVAGRHYGTAALLFYLKGNR
jgi:glycosyltransferase involved in cell wall biosynthesis